MNGLKLNALANQTLSGKEMNNLYGAAGNCCCGCSSEGSGGSSTGDNFKANDKKDLKSPNCNPLPEVVIDP
ncbi:MAG: rSAM-modified peptide [Dysgonamonadaceae bacterium]|jgi:natural product precursor|nr:rSAM-modified peptide [Dysgonamonadaceae bacterium]